MHVTLGQQAELIIVAPATANLLARAAGGIADDLLTATLLAATAPVLAAPAMNDEMYAQLRVTAGQLRRLLVERGWHVVGPGVGDLAEGPSDRPGRMAEVDVIIAHAARILRGATSLAGKHVLITAGPTREAIDPQRVLTNRSSGKMGYRLAEAAWQRGAIVTLISGPSAEAEPIGVDLVRVESTIEMADAVKQNLPSADVYSPSWRLHRQTIARRQRVPPRCRDPMAASRSNLARPRTS